MGNKIAASLLVVVFTIVALLSISTSVLDSAAAKFNTYNEAEMEQFEKNVEEGEKSIMNCVIVIGCLIVGFVLGRAGSNVCDGLLVLGSRPGDHQVRLAMPDEALPRCQVITLRVVNEEE